MRVAQVVVANPVGLRRIVHNRRLRRCCKTSDGFVVPLSATAQSVFSGHCEGFEESRGNLEMVLAGFFTRPVACAEVAL